MKVQVSSNNVQPGDAARDVAVASALEFLAMSSLCIGDPSGPVCRGSSGVEGGQYAGDWARQDLAAMCLIECASC
jgi:hypothetical protein